MGKKAKQLMKDAAIARDEAGDAFKTAAEISATLPTYEREAEQAAFHAESMLNPEAVAPSPLLSVPS